MLVKHWVSGWKAFRLAGHEVLFSVFNVVLMTGLLVVGMRVVQ